MGFALVTVSYALPLAGCVSSDRIAGFFERHQGGEIATPQPAPPGAGKPYPSLATVPPRPPTPDQAKLRQLSDQLIAARERTLPLLLPTPADPSLPSTSPQLFGVGTVPPPAANPSPGVATASLAAANGPTAPAPPPPTQPAALPARVPAASSPPTIHAAPPPPTMPAASPPPTMQAAPPPPPSFVRLGTRPVASPARAAPSWSPPARLAANPATTVVVAFRPGSAMLSADAAAALKQLATKRGDHPIAVIGHGDARGFLPASQGAAVGLGLERAQAIGQALAAAGVPENAIRIGAEAEGRGGVARLLE